MKPPPVSELVNVLEVAEAAKAKLTPALFAEVANIDGSRRAFDRITFRPRLMHDVTGLDLSVELLGQKHFAPILIGPIANAKRFHPEGETALQRGAEAGKASADWVYLEPGSAAPAQATVVVLSGAWDGPALDRLRKNAKAPVVRGGIHSVEAARAALGRGLAGIIVSNSGANSGAAAGTSTIEVLPAIVDAVGGRIPVLAGGGFRRGTDIAKALAFGASAVVIGRPAVWGLAAYGSEGVRHVVELLQSELARAVAMLGRSSVKQLDRSCLRLHRW